MTPRDDVWKSRETQQHKFIATIESDLVQ
jgi:hypothetical protein